MADPSMMEVPPVAQSDRVRTHKVVGLAFLALFSVAENVDALLPPNHRKVIAGFKREVQHLTERPPPGFESEGLAAADD
jgi:hypothetical protein